MTRSLLLPGLAFACALGIASVASAEVAPASMGADARVRSVLYNPVDVIRLDTHLRVNTAIELGAGERIDSVLLGDSEAFEVEVLSNRTTVSVKPLIAGAETNMTIYTGRRTISLSISEGRSRNPTYRLVLRYPETGTSRAARSTGGRRLARHRLCLVGRRDPETRPYLERWASDLFRLRTGSSALDLRRRCDGPRSDAELRHAGQHRPRARACAPPIRSGSARRFCASSGWMAA